MSNFKKFCFFQKKKIYCSKNARIPLNLGGAEFLQKFTVYVFANQILLLRFFCGYTPKLGGAEFLQKFRLCKPTETTV